MRRAKTQTIYIGLGSNQGNAANHIHQALDYLSVSNKLRIDSVSPFFRTEPQGFRDQDWFVNAVARLQALPGLDPEELLNFLSGIEESMGRVRTHKWGPRIIDLDILFWKDQIRQSPSLIIPHPRMCERAFVLVPLMYLDPELCIEGKTPEQWLRLLTYSLDNDIIYQSHL